MKKAKQVLAMIGVILLVALYLGTLVLAILGKDFFPMFMAALATTLVLPVILWLYTLMEKSRKEKKEKNQPIEWVGKWTKYQKYRSKCTVR